MNFDKYNKDCPAFIDPGKCLWIAYYNQHVNDIRYGDCDQCCCPIYYWATALEEKQDKKWKRKIKRIIVFIRKLIENV